jgi:cytochrome d ubiquinol oxidase subunit I
LFTLLGFAGIYLLMGLLYVLLVVFEALHGPETGQAEKPNAMTEGLID